MAKYPGIIPTLDEIFKAIDYQDWTNAEKWNNLRAELRAALVELGTDPAGDFATVKARLDDLLPHFHKRAALPTHDFTLGDFTTDGAWHDLDLSGLVPAGTKGVVFYIVVLDDAIDGYLLFCEKGSSGTQALGIARTQVANLKLDSVITLPCDVNRKLEYLGKNTVFTAINLTVIGWWE